MPLPGEGIRVSDLDPLEAADDDDIIHVVRMSEPEGSRSRTLTVGQIAASILERVPQPPEPPEKVIEVLPDPEPPELKEGPPPWPLWAAVVIAGAMGGGAVIGILRLAGL